MRLPPGWVSGELSSSPGSAIYLSVHKSPNLCDLHSPPLRNEGAVLHDLASSGPHTHWRDYLCWRVSGTAAFFVFFGYHRSYSESSTAWIQMWTVSVTKTALETKLLGLTAIQPGFSFFRCHYNKCYGQHIQLLICIHGWIRCSCCNSMRAVFLLIRLSQKKLLPWFLS